jgi:hypothetical protein
MKVEREEKRLFRLWLPFFLFWFVLIPLVLALSPLVLIVALAMKKSSHRKLMFSAYPILFSSLWSVSGLSLQFEKDRKKFSIQLL